jgi:hypothetical protein
LKLDDEDELDSPLPVILFKDELDELEWVIEQTFK